MRPPRDRDPRRAYTPFAPDLGRPRRQFTRQSNPIVWLLPLLAFAVMVAAVLRLLPDLSRGRADFAPSYVEAHHTAIEKLRTRPPERLYAEAETTSVYLRLRPGLARRVVAAGASLRDARKSTAFFEHQLELILGLRGAAQPVSLFEERIGPRTLDTYRRRDEGGDRFYISSAARPKTPPDSVIVWTQHGMLFTLVGAAPEDTLIAFARRVLLADTLRAR